MTYEPSETFTHRMIEVQGNWIDPSHIIALSSIERLTDDTNYFFVLVFKGGGELHIDSDSVLAIERAHSYTLKGWDRELQRAQLEKQFKEGLSEEQQETQEPPAHGVTVSVTMPEGTPKADVDRALNEACKAILERVDDAGGGL